MKKWLSILLAASMVLSVFPVSATAAGAPLGEPDIMLNETNFPDPAFREYLENTFDTNNDGIINPTELAEITSLAPPQNVNSLMGLELFPDITRFSLSGDEFLTSIDLSHNTKLEYLSLFSNNIRKLDLRHTPNLSSVICYDNGMEELLLPETIGSVYCNNNNLATLDLSNTSIRSLRCQNNQLSILDFSKSPLLTDLNASNNKLTNPDFSGKSELISVAITNNPLVSVNVNGCTTLEYMNLGETSLPKLDLMGLEGLQTLISVHKASAKAEFRNDVPTIDMKLLVGEEGIKNVVFEQSELDPLKATYNTNTGILTLGNNTIQQYIHYLYNTQNTAVETINVELSIEVPDKPEAPVSEPETPTSEPETSTSEPETPTSEPETPTSEPETPTSEPETPTSEPETPTSKPETPTSEPETPTSEPETPASKPEATPTYPTEGIGGFISRLYLATFGRVPDAGGLEYWTNAVKEGKADGSSLVSFFFLSPEFIAKPQSNEEVVELVYKALLNRPSDADGKAYWAGNLNGGVSLTGMLASFVTTPEFAQICSSYGIAVGNITVTEARDKAPNLTKFLSRMYTKVLGRTAEPGGLNHWAVQMLSGEMNAEDVAKQFVFSEEYLSNPHSDGEYLEMLYRAFMGREAESGGLAYWQEQLSAGVNREQVFKSFAASEEFKQIQKEFGI